MKMSTKCEKILNLKKFSRLFSKGIKFGKKYKYFHKEIHISTHCEKMKNLHTF